MPFIHLVSFAGCLTHYFKAGHYVDWCVTPQLRSLVQQSRHYGRIFGSLWVSFGSAGRHCSCAKVVIAINLACWRGVSSLAGLHFGSLCAGLGLLLGIYRNTAFRCWVRGRRFIRTYSAHCKIHWLCQIGHFSSSPCVLKSIGSTVQSADLWCASLFVRSYARRCYLVQSSIVGADFTLLFVS